MAATFDDVQELASASNCLTCLNDTQLQAVQAYLLQQILDNPTPVIGLHDLLSLTHPDTLPGPPTRGALVVGNATPLWAALPLGAANQVLRTNGTDALWAKVALGTDVTGQLPLANGGTNNNITADPGAVVYSTAAALALTLPGLSGQLLQSNGLAAPDWTTSTYPTAAGASGTILISDGTNWIVSTTTYSNTVAINSLLYASAANTITGLAPANSSVLGSTATGVPTWLGPMTNGQLIIGSTGATPVAASLTAGANILITPGAGSITIATTGLVGTHTVLDATVHTDTVTQTVTRGSIIVGNSTPRWDELVLGGSGTVLRSNGTDLVYSTFTIPDTYTTGDIIYASATNVFSALADVSAGSYLRSGGVATAPLWSTVKIPNTATTGDLWQGTAANTITALASVAAGSYLRSGGVATASVWSTLTLPNASAQGDLFYSTAANAMIVLNKNTTATRYLSNRGTNNDPLWAQVRLTDGVEGILPVANGGSGTSTAFTPGSVIFAGAAGVYSQDNAAFFWDIAADRLGIGTNSTVTTLTVKGPAIIAASTASALPASALTGASLVACGLPSGPSFTVLNNRLLFCVSFNHDYGAYLGNYDTDGTTAGLYGVIGTRGNAVDAPIMFLNQGRVMFSNKTDLSTLPAYLTFCHVDGSFYASLYLAPVAIGTGASVDEEFQINSLTIAAGTPGTKEMMILFRPLNSGVSYPQAATIALGTFSTNNAGNGFGPDTRLDFKLKSLSSVDSITDLFVMTLTDRAGGALGIATIDPLARLHLPAGATGVGGAPLMFSTGSYTTAAVAGQVEWHAATAENLTFSPSTTRYRIPLVDSGVGGLTSGRVPFATTNGRLTDEAAFTYDSGADTLSIVDLIASGNVQIGGQITSYLGFGTGGVGVPFIIFTDGASGQTASIPATDIPDTDNGYYRMSYYLLVTTSDAGAGTVQFRFDWDDGEGARSHIGASVPLTSTGKDNNHVFFKSPVSNTNYRTTVVTIGTAEYELFVSIEKISNP